MGSGLDPITSQIINTQDAALEVMHLIENGAAKRFWESQKTLPSVTWLGDMVDRLFGWGRYAPKTEESSIHRKVLTSSEDICSKVPTKTEGGTHKEQVRNIVWDTLNTSFEVQNYPNGSCSLINSNEYYFFVDQFVDRDISGPDDIVCRIGDCFEQRIMSCVPFCLPCENATETEKHNFSTHFWSYESFQWAIDSRISWMYTVAAARGNLSLWKADQIYRRFNTTLKECENQLFPPVPPSGKAALYALFIIPVAIGGVVGAVVCLHKKRCDRKKLQYDPLGSENAIL